MYPFLFIIKETDRKENVLQLVGPEFVLNVVVVMSSVLDDKSVARTAVTMSVWSRHRIFKLFPVRV